MNKSYDKNSLITVMGIGNAGVHILSEFSAMLGSNAGNLKIYGIDSDKSSLELLNKEVRIPAAFEWTDGLGCGGDIAKGERTISKIRPVITEKIKDSSLLFICGGLGSGEGTGGAPVIARIAKSNKVPTVFILTMPFSFEGHKKQRIAKDGLKELLRTADVVITLPNDLLFSSLPSDTPFEAAFAKANIEAARVIKGITDVFLCKSLIPLELSTFKNMLNKKKTVCSAGIGTVAKQESGDACLLALERLLESAFLGGQNRLNDSDAIFFIITADSSLSISDVKRTIEAFEGIIKDDIPLYVGANCDPEYENALQVTVLAVKYLEPYEQQTALQSESGSTKRDKNKHRKKKNAAYSEHDELPLVEISRGIFSKLPKTLYKGDDIDVPTFQRKNILIDKGD